MFFPFHCSITIGSILPARAESSSGRVRSCSGRDSLIIEHELVYILCTSCVHLLYMCCTHGYTICTEYVHKMYTSYCSIIRLSLREHNFALWMMIRLLPGGLARSLSNNRTAKTDLSSAPPCKIKNSVLHICSTTFPLDRLLSPLGTCSTTYFR